MKRNNLSLRQLTNKFDIELKEVIDVNNPTFLDKLELQEIIGCISIRCYQRFKSPFINMYNKMGRFAWNLHPGKLPDYQGVSVLIREMINGDKFTANTLHKIN